MPLSSIGPGSKVVLLDCVAPFLSYTAAFRFVLHQCVFRGGWLGSPSPRRMVRRPRENPAPSSPWSPPFPPNDVRAAVELLPHRAIRKDAATPFPYPLQLLYLRRPLPRRLAWSRGFSRAT